MLERIKAVRGDDLRFVYRHLPLLSIHDKAQLSAEASEAAGAQGLFWEMHDILFANQAEWSGQSQEDAVASFVAYAEEIGVPDVALFETELTNGTYSDKVLADYDAARAAGLGSTPSLVINQVDYPINDFGLSQEGIELFISLMSLRNSWYQGPEQVINPELDYTAVIETEAGDITVELFPDTAPVNVNSFVFLAQEGWYDGVTFHRVLPGFVAQAGDPTGTGVGFPGYRCVDEVTPERSFDAAGLVALANSGPNSNGSQFFITYDAVPNLNAGFTIIGRVIEGLDVAEGLTPRDPQQQPNAPPGDEIITISINEAG